MGIPHSFAYSASLVAIGVVLYVVTIPMYLHIFLHVRRSGNRVGVKNYAKLAKKISILVFSNFMFFLLPTFIGFVWLFTKAFDSVPLTTREILVGSFTTICFSVNSFLNPLLYSFRDRRFLFVIRQRYCRLLHPNNIEIFNAISRTEARSNQHKMAQRRLFTISKTGLF